MEVLEQLKKYAQDYYVPIIRDKSADFLCKIVKDEKIFNILEIGTAIGYSGSIMLLGNKNAKLTTIELNEDRFNKAKETFLALNLENRVNQILGDAKEELLKLVGKYDFIFLDGPKGQYLSYLNSLLSLLNTNGKILADNIFLGGAVLGTVEVKKNKLSMVNKLKAFVEEITTNKNLKTTIYDIEDGLAVIEKIN